MTTAASADPAQGRGRAVGTTLIVVSSAAFATLPIFAKIAYQGGAEPIALMAWRFGIAATLLIVATCVRGAIRRERPFPPLRLSLTLLAVGALLLSPEVLLFFIGLQSVSAGLAEILLYLYPAWVVIIGAVAFRQRPTRVTVLCVAGAVVGAAVTVGSAAGGAWGGVAMLVLGSALFATYILVASRIVPRAGSLPGTTLVISGAAITFIVLAPLTGSVGPSEPRAWTGVLGMALVGTVVAFGLLSMGLGRVAAPTAAVIATIEPVIAVFLGAVVLGEPVGPAQVVGTVLILVSVGILLRHEARAEQGHGPLLDPLVRSE